MQDLGEFNPAAFFEEEPPPTWASPEWRWGSPDGEAEKVAERVRENLAKPHRRSQLIAYANMGAVDFFDLKMVLALKCSRASAEGYDAADGRWKSLVDEMAAGHFELEQRIDQPKLAAAINQRLASGPIEPVDIDGNANAAGVVAAALSELEFVAKGL